jgi:hypothetical protein
MGDREWPAPRARRTGRDDLRDQFAESQFNRDVERVVKFGPRVVAELLAELGRQFMIRTAIETVVAEYATLDPAVIRTLRADKFPPRPPLQVIVGGRRS